MKKTLIVLLLILVPVKVNAGLVTAFDPLQVQTPESVAVGLLGEYYVSMGLTGQIIMVYEDNGSYVQELHSQLPIDPTVPCPPYGEIMGALAIEVLTGNIYVTVNSCDPSLRGVYKVPARAPGDPPSTPTKVCSVGTDALINGIVKKYGQVFFVDSALGLVWTAPANGGDAQVWLDHPLLKQDPPGGMIPGPNGIQYYFSYERMFFGYMGELYVANSSTANIIRIPMEYNHGIVPGDPVVHATLLVDGMPQGADDFALALDGTIYAVTDFFNTLLKVETDGTVSIFACGEGYESLPCYCEHCLDGGSSVAFDRWEYADQIVVTNAAFPFFSEDPDPSLWRFDVGQLGFPR